MKTTRSQSRQNKFYPPPPLRLLLAALILLMSSCEKPSLESEGPNVDAVASADQKAGKKGNGKNPFSVVNMREAYANLAAAAGSCLDCGPTDPAASSYPVQPTHLYIRFKPANTDQIADLGDLGYRLSWEPYNEDVAAMTAVNYDSEEIP